MLLDSIGGTYAYVQIALLVFILWIYFALFRKSKTRKILERDIPGPPKLPFLGNALELSVPNYELLGVFERWEKAYGKRVFFMIGSELRVALLHCNDVEKVFGSNIHIEKSYDYKFLSTWLGQGLITSKGETWFPRRRLLTPAFHFSILESFLPILNDHAATLLQILEKKSLSGEPFDVFPFITTCALDSISETAMGVKLNAQENPESDYVKSVYRISELMLIRIVRPWLYPDFIWNLSPSGREAKTVLRTLHEFTNQVIQKKKMEFSRKKLENEVSKKEDDDSFTTGKRKLAFLDLLLETQAQQIANGVPSPLSDSDIREEVDTFMFAGHDTTTANICWSIFLLGLYPQVQEKVQEELDMIFNDDRDRAVTTQDISRMKYLECCIKEALRIYPSVPLVSRSIIQPLKLDDSTTIPPGTSVFIMPYLLHRDVTVFPDPENFMPERFFPENANGRHPYAYTPFAAGPRNCIGQKFAMMEIKVTLSYIFRNFHVTSMDKREDVRLCPDAILRPKDGITIKLSRRT